MSTARATDGRRMAETTQLARGEARPAGSAKQMRPIPLITTPIRLPDPNLYSPEVQEEMRLIMEGKRQ